MSRNEQIRREMGFGQGTLGDKRKAYYDPFETRPEPEVAQEPNDDTVEFLICLDRDSKSAIVGWKK